MKIHFRSISITLIILNSLILPELIFAQSGDPDNSFGFDGKTTFDMGSVSEKANAVLLQDDGKIVVGGSINKSPNMSFAVMRFLTDGIPDVSFGGTGFVQTFVEGGNSVVNAIAIQSDGKIVAAGNYQDGAVSDILITRYLADGSADESFGINGIVFIDLLTERDKVFAVQIQNDGKIIVAGCTYGQYGEDFVLLRFNSDGTPDDTFGENGIVTTDFEGYYYDIAYDMEILDDGKILVAGVTANGYYEYFALARYKSNGDLDVSFGEEGLVVASFSTHDNHLSDIVPLSDGKILAGGFSNIGSNHDNPALARFNANGTLDTGFGIDGWSTEPETYGDDEILSIAVQPGGKIVATYYYPEVDNKNFYLYQYDAQGNIDESFGEEGIVITDFDERIETANAIIIQPDKKILVVGSSMLEDASDENIVLARYMGDFGLATMDHASLENIKIDPNPYIDQFTINAMEIFPAELILYDLLGNTVHQEFLLEGTATIKTPLVPAGIYFAAIRTENNIQTITLVKQ